MKPYKSCTSGNQYFHSLKLYKYLAKLRSFLFEILNADTLSIIICPILDFLNQLFFVI